MIDVIRLAVEKGAKIYPNVSGGKDGQAMTAALAQWGFAVEGLVHADLGSIEWKESLPLCQKQADQLGVKLHKVTRADGIGMVQRWKNRMDQMAGTGKPFWSSSSSRYCTSDMKRDPINRFYNSTGHKLIISCEGIRAAESKERAKKCPLEIRDRVSSTYYKGMTPEQAIMNFRADKKLVITWYPIFNYSQEDVWTTCGNSGEQLEQFRAEYKATRAVNSSWNFHPAYVYGNERVSCMMCVLGCAGDIANGAKFNPEVYQELVQMEKKSGFTFRKDYSLATLSKISKPKK